jgi:hypothetical protein
MDTREALAKRVGDGIAWRAAAQPEPDDEGRNRRSADALTELAAYVMTLSPTDRRLQAIAELDLRQDAFTGTEDEVDRLIAGYGSNRHLQSHPDTFLGDLIVIADEKARLTRRARG